MPGISVDDSELIQEIEAQAAPGSVLTRDVPMTGSPRFITFSGLYGDNFDRYVNPDSVSFVQYDQMRKHSKVRAALILIKAPILAAFNKATVECDDPKIKRAVEHQFLDSGLLYQLARTSLRAQEFGVAFHEKVWDVQDIELTYTETDEATGETIEDSAWSGPMHVFTEIREVNPETVRFILRDPKTRRFSGFVQAYAPTWIDSDKRGALSPDELKKYLPKDVDVTALDGVPILAQKAFLYSYDVEFGNLWGSSRLRSVFPYYWWAQVFLKYWMAWGERKIVPTRIARHPVGRAPDGTDYSDLALQIANAIDDVNAVAVPNSRMQEPGQWHGGDFQWHFEEVATTDKAETFKLVIDYLESAMLWAMFVPERTFTAGQGFSLYSTDAQAHTDTFLMTEDADAGDLANAINSDAVHPFVVDNFGPDADRAYIRVPGLTDAQRETLREVLAGLLTNPDTAAAVDERAILEQLGVPTKPERDVQPAAGVPGMAPDGTVSAAAPGAGVPGTGTDAAAAALPAGNGDSGAPTGVLPPGAPANLVLETGDADPIALAASFDPSRWSVTPDPKALNGFKVIDQTTGQRITGFAAQKVVDAFKGYAAAQSKKSASAAASAQKKAANKAAADEKKAANAVTAAQKKATNQAAAAQKKAATAQTNAEKKAARDAATAQHKEASQADSRTKALASAVQQEKNQIQSQTAKMAPDQAAKLLKANGFDVQATVTNEEYDTLVQHAAQVATSDPNSIYTIVKANSAYMLVSKPKSALASVVDEKRAAPHNIALEDGAGHAAGAIDDSLLTSFAKRFRARLRRNAA